MKIAGSCPPGMPDEVIVLDAAVSIFVKSPASCQLKEPRNHIQAPAAHWEARELLRAIHNRTTSTRSP